MDDLFLLIAYQLNNIPSINTANNIKRRILNFGETYKGGLELENNHMHILVLILLNTIFQVLLTIDQPNDDYFTISLPLKQKFTVST